MDQETRGDKSALCRKKSVGLGCIVSTLVDFSNIDEAVAFMWRFILLFGWINNCKCTAPLLLDHGDVPKSDAAKSRSCEIRLSLLRVSSTFLRRIPRNNQQNFWERPENQVRDKNQTNRTIPEPRKDNNNDAR